MGPFRREFWRSPLRGPWLTSLLGSALLPLIMICATTGLLSHGAYDPEFARNSPVGGGGIDLLPFDWPTRPAWLYAFTQGLHVISGLAAMPILLAKLWSVVPTLFEHPPLRSLAHALERLSLAFLVGGSLFVFFTGILNIQLFYPWNFSFVPAHYWASFIFLAALGFHLVLKIPVVRDTFRRTGVLRPIRTQTSAAPPAEPAGKTVTPNPSPATISRRGFVSVVGLGSFGLAVTVAGQVVGGPFRRLAFLAPRGRDPGSGPNGFQVNKTAAGVGIEPAQTGADWRLKVVGTRRLELSREDLLRLPQGTERLPIACVEGWSTTQEWTGVPLRDLASMCGLEDPESLFVESIQKKGAFRLATLNPGQAMDPRSLLALKVNGADLSPDHGFPARIIVPGIPGVHNTKWVGTLTYRRA